MADSIVYMPRTNDEYFEDGETWTGRLYAHGYLSDSKQGCYMNIISPKRFDHLTNKTIIVNSLVGTIYARSGLSNYNGAYAGVDGGDYASYVSTIYVVDEESAGGLKNFVGKPLIYVELHKGTAWTSGKWNASGTALTNNTMITAHWDASITVN